MRKLIGIAVILAAPILAGCEESYTMNPYHFGTPAYRTWERQRELDARVSALEEQQRWDRFQSILDGD